MEILKCFAQVSISLGIDGWMGRFADACTFLRVLIRYITSDCDAVSIIHDAQGYAKTAEDAVADVLKAGMSSLQITMHEYTTLRWISPQYNTSHMELLGNFGHGNRNRKGTILGQ